MSVWLLYMEEKIFAYVLLPLQQWNRTVKLKALTIYVWEVNSREKKTTSETKLFLRVFSMLSTSDVGESTTDMEFRLVNMLS